MQVSRSFPFPHTQSPVPSPNTTSNICFTLPHRNLFCSSSVPSGSSSATCFIFSNSALYRSFNSGFSRSYRLNSNSTPLIIIALHSFLFQFLPYLLLPRQPRHYRRGLCSPHRKFLCRCIKLSIFPIRYTK